MKTVKELSKNAMERNLAKCIRTDIEAAIDLESYVRAHEKWSNIITPQHVVKVLITYEKEWLHTKYTQQQGYFMQEAMKELAVC